MTHEQRRARAGCITASVVKRVVNAKTPKAHRTLLADIRSELAAIEQDIFTEMTCAATEWGRTLEPRAIGAYVLATGNDVEPSPFVRMGDLPIGCSPDGLVGEDGLVEVKCPFSPKQSEAYRRGEIDGVIPQMMMQMWVTGRKWCDFVGYDPRLAEPFQLTVLRVARDEAYISDLAAKVLALAQHLIDGTEPTGTKFDDERRAA